jgi:hypothetical protein
MPILRKRLAPFERGSNKKEASALRLASLIYPLSSVALHQLNA